MIRKRRIARVVWCLFLGGTMLSAAGGARAQEPAEQPERQQAQEPQQQQPAPSPAGPGSRLSEGQQRAGASPASPNTSSSRAAWEHAGVPLSLAAALATTLRDHPSIRAAQAELSSRSAEVEIARAPYDPLFNATVSHTHNRAPVLPPHRLTNEHTTVSDVTALTLGASLSTQYGTTVVPSVGLSRLHERWRPTAIPLLQDPYQQAQVGITVIQRLLRGAGRLGAASNIESATLARRSARHAVIHVAQEQALVTATAYFQLVAASEELSLLHEAEAATRKLIAETTLLVEAEMRPRADLRQLEANLANRRLAVLQAQNERLQALYRLRFAMGLPGDSTEPFEAVDFFPMPRPERFGRSALVRRALNGRSDVRAAKKLVEATTVQLRAAEWNTLPALDLSGSVGYTGALDRDGMDAFFQAAGSNVRGVNAGVALSLELPLSNTGRAAERDLRRAQHEQARIAASDLERAVSNDVLRAEDDLELSAAALEASILVVQKFEQSVLDERDKLKEGVGTVIDLLLTEDLLITARQNQVRNHLRYALAQSRLFFELGALPSEPQAAASAASGLVDRRRAHGKE